MNLPSRRVATEIPLHRHHAATVKRCPHDPLNDWQRGRTSDHRKPAISCDRRRLQPHLFHGRTRRPQWYSPPLRDDARRAHASKDPPGLRCKSRIPGSCARRNEGAVSRLHFFGFLGRRPGKMNLLNWTLPSHEFSVQSRWAVGFAPASGKDRAAGLMSNMGASSPGRYAARSARHRMAGEVLGADLNCSESTSGPTRRARVGSAPQTTATLPR
jgi:hypothetical protein